MRGNIEDERVRRQRDKLNRLAKEAEEESKRTGKPINKTRAFQDLIKENWVTRPIWK